MPIAIIGYAVAAVALATVVGWGASAIQAGKKAAFERGVAHQSAIQAEAMRVKNEEIEAVNSRLRTALQSVKDQSDAVVSGVERTVETVVIPAQCAPSSALPGATIKALNTGTTAGGLK